MKTPYERANFKPLTNKYSPAMKKKPLRNTTFLSINAYRREKSEMHSQREYMENKLIPVYQIFF